MAKPQATPYAKRIERLPLYLFADLERKVAAKRKAGVDVISLGIGDPDLPPPSFIVDSVKKHLTASLQWLDHRFAHAQFLRAVHFSLRTLSFPTCLCVSNCVLRAWSEKGVRRRIE